MAEKSAPGGMNPDFNYGAHLEEQLHGQPERLDIPRKGDELPAGEWLTAVDAAHRVVDDHKKEKQQLQGEIYELRDAEFKARYEAEHDELTGLLDTRGLRKALAGYMSQPGISHVELLFVDGTNIKKINDKLSHEAGNDAIKGIAGILSRSIRTGDILARIGGDEFVIIPDGKGAPVEQGLERRQDVKTRGEILEKRIRDLTEVYLEQNPHLVEQGMELAVGRKQAVNDENFDFSKLKKEAEDEMKIQKAEQHERVGRYRGDETLE